MFRDKQLKFRRANLATDPLSHQNQNRSFDNGGRLDRRVMRNMANRAGRVGTSRVVVREVRLGGHEQQREDGQADR